MSETNEEKLKDPGEIVERSLNDLNVAKENHLAAADEIDSTIRIVAAARPYWIGVDREALAASPTGTAAIDYLNAFGNQATVLREASGEARDDAASVLSTASGYGPVTDSAQAIVFAVPDFDPWSVQQEIDRPGRDEKYAAKFDNLDSELGKLYRQILQVRSRTTSHPAKSVLPDVRQAYDHLIRIQAPDDDVRDESGWVANDPDKPRQVTRAQRLDYALRIKIDDESRRATLAANTKHALAVHGELSGMYHSEEPIDLDKARAAAGSMLEVLNQWADALAL